MPRVPSSYPTVRQSADRHSSSDIATQPEMATAADMQITNRIFIVSSSYLHVFIASSFGLRLTGRLNSYSLGKPHASVFCTLKWGL